MVTICNTMQQRLTLAVVWVILVCPLTQGGCQAKPPARSSLAAATEDGVIAGGDHCNLDAYTSILKESADVVDEASSRISGQFVTCEFPSLDGSAAIDLGARIAAHLEFHLQHLDVDVYRDNAELLEDWLTKYTSRFGDLTPTEKEARILADFLLVESSIVKRRLNLVTKNAVAGHLSSGDMQRFAAKFLGQINLVEERYRAVKDTAAMETWMSEQISAHISDVRHDVVYLETGSFCNLISMDLFVMVEEKISESCHARPLQY